MIEVLSSQNIIMELIELLYVYFIVFLNYDKTMWKSCIMYLNKFI